MDSIITEIRFALRHLARSPSFSILVTLIVVPTLIVAAALVASLIPALRASRVEPSDVLRGE